jgi:predicted N-acetyltransferase YhbS
MNDQSPEKTKVEIKIPKDITIRKATKKEKTWVKAKLEELDFIYSDLTNSMVAVKDQKIVGMACAEYFRRKKLATISGVYTEPDFRGKKLGLALCQAIMNTYKASEWHLAGRPWIEQYYRQIGFEPIKEKITELKRDIPGQVFMRYLMPSEKMNNIPDLIVIDGGKGQLSAVMKAALKLKVGLKKSLKKGQKPVFDPHTQIISLAKREEEIFRPGESTPLDLPSDTAASKLLQRIRDEAHRFAITFNRSVRKKQAIKSILDEIEGVGPSTKKKLLKTFGTVRDIKRADDKALRKVLSEKQLKNLRKTL